MINIGLIQSDIHPENIEKNLQHYTTLLAQYDQHRFDLLIFPEAFATGFSCHIAKSAEQHSASCIRFLQQTAQQRSCDVVGSVFIQENGKIFNRLFWFSVEGLRGTYDKKHLFLGDELTSCTPGDKRTVIEMNGVRFLPLICYDIRFPKWSRNSLTNGKFDYDVLVYVTNFPAPREATLLKLAQARAIENQAFVLVVNRIGLDGSGITHNGGTSIIDPEGQILAAAAPHHEEILSFELYLSGLEALRKRFPVSQQWD